MTFLTALLRIFAFLYHLPLALFFFGVSIFGLLDRAYNMEFPMLPWSGRSLLYWLLGLSVFGLVSQVLAMRGKTRWLFALYAILAAGLMVNGFFFGNYYFGDEENFRLALWFVAGALVALVGAILHARRL